MRKLILLSLMIITSLSACKNSEKKTNNSNIQIFYVGTYTNGESEGIYKFFLNDTGKLEAKGLAASTTNPSFLSLTNDNKYLLAVGETNTQNGGGTVLSFEISKDSLTLINESLSGGAHPCHITVNKNGFVISSNYSGGNISLFQLYENGELSPLLDLKQHEGSGTNENRQEGPHAHSSWFVPNSNKIIACDLGTDELWIYELDELNKKLLPAKQAKLKMNDGAGPRHLCFHPKKPWLYVLNELDCTVSLVKTNMENDYYLEASINTLPTDYSEQNTCADIHISSDGRFVYASNRGHNSLAIYEVNEDNGSLIFVGHQSVSGETPRNFSLSPCENFIIVANQDSNNIVSFKRDKNTGLLTKIDEIAAPKPVCIKF